MVRLCNNISLHGALLSNFRGHLVSPLFLSHKRPFTVVGKVDMMTLMEKLCRLLKSEVGNWPPPPGFSAQARCHHLENCYE